MLRLRIFRLGTLILLSLCSQGIFPAPADTAHFYVKHSYDVISYKLDLNLYTVYFQPFSKAFQARETIIIKVDSALNSIKLNAVNSSIQTDSAGLAAISFSHENDTLTIFLDRTYLPGETLSVEVFYNHKNVNDHAFYASGGYAFTDLWPENSRKVFPCWDRPSDKALTEIFVKVPSQVRLGATGYPADSSITGDTLQYHWVSEYPVATYLVSISSKIGYRIKKKWWNSISNPADSIPILLYHKDGEAMGVMNSIIDPLTDFFSQKFGDYPFEKLGFATVNDDYPYGGTENQTMVNLMAGGYSGEDLIAHEHAHQWFGDLITCGTWADIWLHEGFAMYSQKLWREHSYGFEDYKEQMNAIANTYLVDNTGFPIYNPGWAIHTPPITELYNMALTYCKSSCVLFQLRYLVGDSLFFTILKTFTADTNFRYGNAVTEDFIAIANQVSGQDLQWFFDQWVYGPNHPVYQNSFYIEDHGNGEWGVSFYIDQIQTNAGFFKMPIEVLATFEDSSDTLLTVMNDLNGQLFQWNFPKKPVTVIFDPGRKILLKQATTIVGMKDEHPGTGFRLEQNEPNPFSGKTRIGYSVGETSHVRISILDDRGREIRILVNSMQCQGEYLLEFSSESLPTGTCLYVMEADNFRESKKMIVVR